MKIALSLIVCIAMSALVSCKKKNTSDPIVLTYQVTGNVITLTWTSVGGSNLTGYYITRSDSFAGVKPFTTDSKTTTLVDTLPFSPVISYSVVASLRSPQDESHESNVVRITRSDIALADITPYDAIFDQGSQQIYVYSNTGNMQVYDVNSNKWVRNASFASGVGYCDIGTYNGKTELYVPRQDGWLFIYDAATLTKVDQINVGTQLYGVSYNNGILYIVGTLSGSFNYSILSYSRDSKSKIVRLDMSDKNRLWLVPGTNSEFLSVAEYGYLRYFKFDDSGHFVAQIYGTSTGTYPDPSIFEVFPDGNKFISNNTGCIYGKTLDYETVLPHGAYTFTSFCFDNAGQLIYAGCREKQVQAYAMSDYQSTKTLKTMGVPFKLFFNNGAVLCVSTAPITNGGYYGALSSTTFVERF